MGETKSMSRSREAWSEFGDEFTDIAAPFRENDESLSETAEAGSALLNAFGVTLSELGEALQRDGVHASGDAD